MLEPDSHFWPKDKTLIIKERSKVIQENSHQLVSIEIDEYVVTSAQRVGFFNIGSGRVLDKIPGIGSGSGRVGVSKYAIGYFRVSLLVSGIFRYFGYFGYFRVFLGIFLVFRVCWVIPETSGLPDISGNTRNFG